MKIAIVLGTRPEIIKMSPIIRESEKRLIDYFIIHSNQHYSENMDKIFFDQIMLTQPKYNLNAGSGLHGQQTGKILIEAEKVLIKEKPDIVLVEGDTNTVLAGALAASKLHIKVGHVEAGLRSFDKKMPEEKNRILTDHLSDYLFTPTMNSRQNLLNEGIKEEKIYVTGNTVVDAINQYLKFINNDQVLSDTNLESKKYFLTTVHREENTNNVTRLGNILRGLEAIANIFSKEIIYPIHPRTKKIIMRNEILVPNSVRLIEPVGYIEFLWLEKNASLILTDSGGVQEEACIMGVPCVTLRDNTERPETVEIGANILAGTEVKSIIACTKKMLENNLLWGNPYGDGRSGKRILDIIIENMEL